MNVYLVTMLTIVIPLVLAGMGVSFGQGLGAYWGFKAINIQPAARSTILRASMFGMALIETSLALNLAVSVLLFRDPTLSTYSFYPSIARLGIIVTLGLTGFITSVISWWLIKSACLAIARQPFFSTKIFNLLMISLALVQTPILFSFVIAFLIKIQAPSATNATDCIRILASSIAFGLGSIGPLIGIASFTKTILKGLGINRNAYEKLVTFTFISEAMIGTPLIFAFVIALMLMLRLPSALSLMQNVGYLCCALTIGLGTLMPGLQSSKIASATSRHITKTPELYSAIARTSVFAQAFMDTFAIYTFIISIFMLIAL